MKKIVRFGTFSLFTIIALTILIAKGNSAFAKSDLAFAEENKNQQLNPDVLFELTNNYRKKLNLPGFEIDDNTCRIAESRLPQLYNEIFITGKMHSGLYNRKLPYRITENLIYAQTEDRALSWWLNSRVHRLSITGNYKYSCTRCTGKICIQLFTNHSQKQS